MHFLRKHILIFISTLIVGASFLFPQQVGAQSINSYRNLFVTVKTPARSSDGGIAEPERTKIKRTESSGVIYLGPSSFNSTSGKIESLNIAATLLFNEQIQRPWNLVAARKCTSGFGCGDFFENRDYYRIYDQSFVLRFFQKDDAGAITNQVLVLPTNKSFVGSDEMRSLLSQKKPVPFIFKYLEGSGAGWETIVNGVSKTIALGLFKPASNGDDGYNGTNSILVHGQTALLTIPVTAFDVNQKVYMDLWYAGASTLKTNEWPDPAGAPNAIPKAETGDNASILYFEAPAKPNFPYFKIGATEVFTTPKDLNDALSQQYVGASEAASIQNEIGSNRGVMPACHPLNGFGPGEGSLMGCVGLFTYYIIFKPIAFFAWLMGQIFDFFIGYSISDEAYRHDFVLTAWRLVRDISNIFFIIIMIWTGLSAVFSTSNTSYKKVIPTLIVNALIINFSLFITQLAIDASNITARLFYNRIEVCKQEEGGSDCNEKSGPAGVKSISEAIVSSFNPQKIFTDSRLLAPADSIVYEESNDGQKKDAGEINFNSAAQTKVTGLSSTDNEYGAYFTLVSLLMAVISLGVGLMFWKTAFMFVGRIIGLYVAMIFSPFAFLSRDIPMLGSVSGINYKSWIKDLTGYALLAPVFVFFLYIIGQFLQTKFFSALGLNQNSENFFETIMYITIPMLIIYGLINKGVGIAKKFSGEFGEMVQNFATKAVGFTAGAALMAGGAGIAKLGTGVGARLGKSLGNSRVGSWAAKNAESNWFARKMSNGLDWSQKSSWDVRNTKLGGMMKSNAMFSAMGINTGAGTKLGETIGLGGKQFEGGAIAMAKRRAEEKKKKYENRISGFSYLTDDQAKRVWEQKRDAQAGEDAARNYLNTTDDEFKNKTAELKAAEKSIKKLEKDIREAEDNLKKENKLSEKQKEELRATLDNDKKSLKEKKDTVESIQGVQLKAIQDLRDEMKQDKEKEHTVKSSESYDKAYNDAIKAQDKKFGKVDSKDSLANASRRLYFEDLQKNGFWTSQFGKLLPVNAGALTGLTAELQSLLQASLGGWSLAVGGVVGGVVGDMLQSDKEAFEEATSSFLKDYKKKTNKGDAYKDRLKDINDMLKEQIAAHTGVTKDEINLDEMSAEEQKSAIKERVEDLYAEMKASEEDYKKAADAYKATGDKKAFKEAAKATQKAKDLYEKMKSAWEDRIKTEENINKADQNKK